MTRFLRRFRRKLLGRVLLYLLLGIVCFEVVLNLFMVVMPRTFTVFRKYKDTDSYKILCIGDSHSAGGEAGEGLPYPEALAHIFADHCPEVSVEVLNIGQHGFDTRTIALATEYTLDRLRYTPDVMIIQGGINTVNGSWATFAAYHQAKSKPAYRHPLHFLLFVSSQIKTLRVLNLHKEWTRSFLDAPATREFGMTLNEQAYERLVQMASERGIVPMFLGYAAHEEHFLITPMDNVANAYQTMFLHFPQPETRRFLEREGWMAPLGHPNWRGYRFIALWIYRMLTESVAELAACSPTEGVDGPLPEFRYLHKIHRMPQAGVL